MLAIFHKAFSNPPEELNSPASHKCSKKPKLPEETLHEFLSAHPTNAFSMNFGDAAVLAYVGTDNYSSLGHNQRYLASICFTRFFGCFVENILWSSTLFFFSFCRLFCGYDDIYCVFMGSLNNLCAQIKQYGLSRNTNEAMLVIEAYRTLRDRGPYPADQVIKDLDGSFAFVVYDSKIGTVFTALVRTSCQRLPSVNHFLIFPEAQGEM